MKNVIRRAFEAQVDPKYAAKVEADFFEMGFEAAIDKCTAICKQVKGVNHVYINGANLIEKQIHIMMEE